MVTVRQCLFAQPLGQRPTDPGRSRPLQIVVETAPSPTPQLRAICRCPSPNSNRYRRTSFVFRMDFLLVGTCSPFIYGVSMPGDCPASVLPPAVRLWKTFRSKPNAIP